MKCEESVLASRGPSRHRSAVRPRNFGFAQQVCLPNGLRVPKVASPARLKPGPTVVVVPLKPCLYSDHVEQLIHVDRLC